MVFFRAVLLSTVILSPAPALAASLQATPATLSAVLARAKGGDTINLGTGDYGAQTFLRQNFARPVTLVGGTFSRINVVNSSGLDFVRTTVNFVPDMQTVANSAAVRIAASDRVSLSAPRITGGPAVNGIPASSPVGTPNPTGNIIGLPAARAVSVEQSTGVAIRGGTISQFHTGIVMLNSSGLTADRNQISHLRTTPFRAGGVSDLVISNNRTSTSTPWNLGGQGDHGDAVHVWTGTTVARNIRITGNVFDQGSGAAMMGIYLDDDGKGIGFENAVISGNTLRTSDGQGIRLENVSGIVTGNTLRWTGQGDWRKAPRIIGLDGTDRLTITNNIASGLDLSQLSEAARATIRIAGNTLYNQDLLQRIIDRRLDPDLGLSEIAAMAAALDDDALAALDGEAFAGAVALPRAAAVPEPDTWLTFAIGFALLGVAARRRRRLAAI